MTVRIRRARASDVSRMHQIDQEATPTPDAAQKQYDDRYADFDHAAFWAESLERHEEVLLIAEEDGDGMVLGFCWWSRYSAARAYITGQAGAEEYTWDEIDDPLLLQMIHEDRSHRQLFAPDTALLDLEHIAVAPSAQRRGVGTLLLHAGRRLALREDRVHIAVTDEDTTFLQHRGFRTRTRNIVNAAVIAGIPDLQPFRQYYLSDPATEHNAIPAI